MTGGKPKLVDNVKGETLAPKQLTWFSNDDRLIVDGINVKNPVKSIIRKKPAR